MKWNKWILFLFIFAGSTGVYATELPVLNTNTAVTPEEKDSVVVYYSFNITKSGKIKNHKYVRHEGDDIDDELLKKCIQDGKRIIKDTDREIWKNDDRDTIIMPITFTFIFKVES